MNDIGQEEVKSYSEIKAEQKAKKPVSELAKNTRAANANKARLSKKKQMEDVVEERKQTTLKINEQTALLNQLKEKWEKDSNSDDSEEEQKPQKKKKQYASVQEEQMKYMMETLKNIEKKTEKMYTLKKAKSRLQQQQPIIVNTGQQSQQPQSRQQYIDKLWQSTGKRL